LKPKVFIGSSREGVPIADAIHANMTYETECTVWKSGVFQLSENTLSSLIKALRDADFGVFVFSPDDISLMRGSVVNVVRDNVLFELGLFIGRLGAERCFFLIPDNATDLRLPSDLAGITPGVYESGRSDGNWVAAVNPACMQMKAQIARLKSFQDATDDGGASSAPPAAKASKPTRSPVKAAKSALGGDLLASPYKRSYLVTGNTKEHKDKLKEIGCSWNGKLAGWVLAQSKFDELKAAFPGIQIGAEEA
jgi:hypothetical protein